MFTQKLAKGCSQQLWQKTGNDPDVLQWGTGRAGCGVSIPWNTKQPLNLEGLSLLVDLSGIMLSDKAQS